MKIKNLIFIAIIGGTLLNGCKKEKNAGFEDTKNYIINNPKELHVLYEKTLKTSLVLLNDKEIKDFVLQECLKQKSGDYTVALKDIVTKFSSKSGFENSIKTLNELVLEIRKINGGTEPMIFYPRAETIEDNNISLNKSDKLIKTFNSDPISDVLPIAVIQGEHLPDYSTPGYSIDFNGQTVYVQDITEEYAWENDVFVIGSEEFNTMGLSMPDNEALNHQPAPISPILRNNGHSEHAGLIQVTDLNAIEHWMKGKLEFKLRIFLQNGGDPLTIDFPKVKRKHFRDQQWYNYNYFVGSWNNANIGNVMREKWIEDDEGRSVPATITFPASQYQPFAVTYSYPAKENDDDLGLALVQFTDDLDQIYNLSHLNFKRR